MGYADAEDACHAHFIFFVLSFPIGLLVVADAWAMGGVNTALMAQHDAVLGGDNDDVVDLVRSCEWSRQGRGGRGEGGGGERRREGEREERGMY